MRLRFDEQLVAERVERLDVAAIEQLLRIVLRVACGVSNDSLRQRLAGSVQNAGKLTKACQPSGSVVCPS